MNKDELKTRLADPAAKKRIGKMIDGLLKTIQIENKLNQLSNEEIAFLLLDVWADQEAFSYKSAVLEKAMERLVPELVQEDGTIAWTKNWKIDLKGEE
jgi:hypothetical protein